jgi:ankyrin repeat protein
VDDGDADGLRRLLASGAAVDARDRYGQTGIMLAALHGRLEAARVLVEAGADLDHTAKYGLSALMLAAINGRTAVVELLIEARADTTLRGRGAPGFYEKTALDLARDLDRPAIVELLERHAGRS